MCGGRGLIIEGGKRRDGRSNALMDKRKKGWAGKQIGGVGGVARVASRMDIALYLTHRVVEVNSSDGARVPVRREREQVHAAGRF